MENKLKRIQKLKLLHLALKELIILSEISDVVKKKKRSCSVRQINRDRKINGFYEVSFQAMKSADSGQFFTYTRMTPKTYDLLLGLIKPNLVKTSIRKPIEPECRLALTLQYLSQGDSLLSLASSFKLGKETVRMIILETCEVLWNVLQPIYVSEPDETDCMQIAHDFWSLWNMPNCVGAVDGKHIAIKCPPNSGSQNVCREKYSSIVLLAACDAKYRFTFVDVGTYGNQSDGGVFQASGFGKRLLAKTLPIPPPNYLPGTQVKIPYYLVGDAAFPLGINIMRPYPGLVLSADKEDFNKRLLRARQTINNSFGILVARWRILLHRLHMIPENVEKVILACVALHNFLMMNKDDESSYCPPNYADWEDSNGIQQNGLWRSEVCRSLPSATASTIHYSGGRTSIQIRDLICKFLNEQSATNK